MLRAGGNDAPSAFDGKQEVSAGKQKERATRAGSEAVMVLFVHLVGLTGVTTSTSVSLLLSCLRLAKGLAGGLFFPLGPITTETTKTTETNKIM